MLRGKAAELPKDKDITAFCKISLRGYEAQRILNAAGFDRRYRSVALPYVWAAGRRWPRYGRERSEKRSSRDIKRVALKYCGGCNPNFDRVAYAEKVKSAAAPDIEWVTLDDEGLDAVMLITGCETACPRRTLDLSEYRQTLLIRDDKASPEDIVKILLESEGANED